MQLRDDHQSAVLELNNADLGIGTNSLSNQQILLAQDVVSTTEMRYSQAERTLYTIELDAAEAVSHTTSTISLNALAAADRNNVDQVQVLIWIRYCSSRW